MSAQEKFRNFFKFIHHYCPPEQKAACDYLSHHAGLEEMYDYFNQVSRPYKKYIMQRRLPPPEEVQEFPEEDIDEAFIEVMRSAIGSMGSVQADRFWTYQELFVDLSEIFSER